MAKASGFFTPSLRTKIQPSIGVSRSGFCLSEGIFKRVVCSSSIESAGTHVSSSQSRIPKLVNKGCKLVGCGSEVPSLSVSNDDLAKIVDTSDEWISVRTGIRNRRVISGKENLRNLAVEAAKKALKMANVEPDDLDLILLCTSTPEDIFGDAPKGGFRNVLVIGADVMSRFVDWTNRGTCILFGDAAGAVACDAEEDGLLSFDLHSDGEGANLFMLWQSSKVQRELGCTKSQLAHDITAACSGFVLGLFSASCYIKHLGAPINDNENGSVLEFPPNRSSYACVQMNGKEVFRFAVRCVPQSIESALEKAGLTASNIDWLLLHQANQRIIDAVATRLEFPPEKVISNLANYGNTSAASIPLALDEAVRSGKVKPGHTIAAAGFGAGLTWGSAVIRWG
ncbi:hypothetical protein GOBAR_AA18850 [Gossypium barbadense]|uniref:Beta-ketoacyl-[acyl-carrier-protein] synthase III C-terminal domain-containing protein n=1 Tax=Gossypium barbadense TaxID=3634 RepID=A0A2P5XEN9_GOSBA|nr:hypothetical protein GOBAR_AA18850 [Gossypium barbadense]